MNFRSEISLKSWIRRIEPSSHLKCSSFLFLINFIWSSTYMAKRLIVLNHNSFIRLKFVESFFFLHPINKLYLYFYFNSFQIKFIKNNLVTLLYWQTLYLAYNWHNIMIIITESAIIWKKTTSLETPFYLQY